jgi:plastocyanin
MAIGRVTAGHSIRSPVRRFAPTLAAFVLASGCGGDDPPDEKTLTAVPGGAIGMVAREYEFDPVAIELERPGQLGLAIVNQGSLAHNLKLTKDGEEVAGTPVLDAGRSDVLHVDVESGEYEYVCTVGDHADRGMKGQLRVN